jgi:hypothetical protein
MAGVQDRRGLAHVHPRATDCLPLIGGVCASGFALIGVR